MIGQGISGYAATDTHVIQLARLRAHARFDVAQTLAMAKLSERQAQVLNAARWNANRMRLVQHEQFPQSDLLYITRQPRAILVEIHSLPVKITGQPGKFPDLSA